MKFFPKNYSKKNVFDVVVMNPPYKEVGTGEINENEKKLISRHEIKANLSDFIKTASGLLKDKGELLYSTQARKNAGYNSKVKRKQNRT